MLICEKVFSSFISYSTRFQSGIGQKVPIFSHHCVRLSNEASLKNYVCTMFLSRCSRICSTLFRLLSYLHKIFNKNILHSLITHTSQIGGTDRVCMEQTQIANHIVTN